MEKVMYADLTPQEFRDRIKACPIAYLPLGSLEWHGELMPYGTDGYIALDLFERLAQRVGGIVLPMLFMGTDTWSSVGKSKGFDADTPCLYGMDHWTGEEEAHKTKVKEMGQLEGSAYWISEDIFMLYIEAIFRQLKRAGFTTVVGNGHGPSVVSVSRRADDLYNRLGIRFFNCWGLDEDITHLGPSGGHGGISETSHIMAFRPELVQMGRFPHDADHKPVAVCGEDVRVYASKEYGEAVIDITLRGMEKLLKKHLDK